MTRLWLTLATAAVCAAAGSSSTVWADVFVLRNGGRLEGELRNADESPRRQYIVATAAGAVVTLDAEQVEQRLGARPVEQEYEKAALAAPDTAEGQWKMAVWCTEHGLPTQRKTHLERAIELDPECKEARAALGYIKEDGKWITRTEMLQSRGLVQHKGKWLMPQEIELLTNRERHEKSEKEWIVRLNRYQAGLGGSQDAVSREGIRSVKDPAALRGLSNMLRSDNSAKNRSLYIEALANIGVPEAGKILAATAVNDAVEEVRLTCLDYLKKQKNPDVVSYFVGQLRSKDNRIVNRAAVALSAMGDRSAVGPLIDALITTHRFKLVTGGGNMNASFGSGGNGGLAMGNTPKIIKQDIRNRTVLDALTMLTGQNFGFEVRDWKAWYASERQRSAVTARAG